MKILRHQIGIVAALVLSSPGALAQPTINSVYPATLSERVGDHVAFAVYAMASSGTLSYAWYQSGNPSVLSTASTLVLTNIQSTNSGSYSVVVTDGRGSTPSGNVTLNVLPAGFLSLYSTNLVIARVGDGAQPLSGATGNTLYLDQYTSNGVYIDSIQIPDEGLGLPYGTGSTSSAGLPAGSSALLIAGANVAPGNDAGYEAFLGRAPNGLSLSFGGYFQAYPFAGTDVSVGANGGNNWRGIGVVDAFGNYSVAWTNTGLYSGGNHQFHSAVDIDGNATNYYTCGEAGSGNAIKYCNIDFQPANGSGLAAVAGSLGGTRVAQVVGGNLVFTDVGAGIIGIYACSGVPSNIAASTLLIAETNKPLDFAFSPDFRTVYISDNGTFTGTSSPAGGVQRWDAASSGPYGFYTYNYSYTLQMGSGSTIGARALNVDFSAATIWGPGVTGAKVFVTTAETSGNRLLKINDTGLASGATTLITAPINEMLCGVRFGPSFVAPIFSIQPQSETATYGGAVSFYAFAIGTGPLTYQWYFQTNGAGPFAAITNATNGTYNINSSSSNNVGNYYVVVTDPDMISTQSQTVFFSPPATSPVSVVVSTQSPGAVIPTNFLGLSFETANLKSNGVGVAGYMFDSSNTELITLFTNLGIKHLRMGGTSTDTNNEVIPLYVPTNQDIDALFRFVPSAGIKTTVSLRLENGNAALDAALAGYTWSNYNKYLDCFEIGNEPDDYGSGDAQITNYSSYLAKWTFFANTILSNVPQAVFGGPDSGGTTYLSEFASSEAGSAHVAQMFSHFYAGGDTSSLTPAQIVAGLLSSSWDISAYPTHLSQTVAVAATNGFPFRSTEFNSYYSDYPGVAGGNNVFASSLYACDSAHWWAAHNCSGVNFHTFLGKYNATVYYDTNGNYQIYPIGYGIKAFEIGSHGAVMPVAITNANNLNLTAYGVGSTTNVFVTIINKGYQTGENNAAVTIYSGITTGSAQVMYLAATNGAFATNGVTLGGALITNNAPFQPRWTPLGSFTNGQCAVNVPISSVAIVEIQLPPTLTLQNFSGGTFQLRWSYGTLQTSTNAVGPYSDILSAVSPLTISRTNSQQFYRVRGVY